jgi:arylsulfatase A-like enzyme
MLSSSRRFRILSIGVLLLMIIVSLWWSMKSNPARENSAEIRESAAQPHVPVVIYLVDTLRADRLSVYGYARPTSPQLDTLAAESVVFEQAYAPSSWTLPSVTSLITSTFSCEHGMVLKKKLSPALKTLAERLQDAGYFTGGAYNNVWAGPVAGLDRGYDVLIERTMAEQDRSPDVNELLDKVYGRPFLMYLHTMEPHDSFLTPYKFISEFGHVGVDGRNNYYDLITRYNALKQADWIGGRPVGTTDNTQKQDLIFSDLASIQTQIELLYDAAVLWADANLGQVIDLLKHRGVWDDAIFIFLSDHGEEFNEHGGWLHSQSAYEELVHVPLIIHFPHGRFGGQRIDTPVSLVDIMPTIFDYLERPEWCEDCQGSTLMPLISGITGQAQDEPLIPSLRLNKAFYYRPVKQSRGDLNVVIRQNQWKGIWNHELESMEIYDLDSDSGEQSNVSRQRLDLQQAFSMKAREWLRDCQASAKQPLDIVDVDEEIEEKLRALGYFH